MNANIFDLQISRRRLVAASAAAAVVLPFASRLSFAQESTPSPAAAAAVATWTKYNMDTITSDQILTIPNAGDRMTREFEEYRPYTSILQFRREISKYVGDDVTAAYEKYIFVAVDPNNADADTLQQLPGLTSDGANSLIAARPFDSNDAFVTALGQLVSADQATAAPGFLTGSAGDSLVWQLFNVNTTGNAQLLSVPGLSEEILASLKQSRPYTSIGQFRTDLGSSVDSSVVSGFEKYVFVPIDTTNADTDTLLQLPGVTDDIVSQLADGEPYASTADFHTAISALVSAEQAANAATFLV